MTDWQPIETAPDDGRDMLLFGPWDMTHGEYQIGYWSGENWHFQSDLWIGDDEEFQPTHWMPLPEPPA